MTPSKTNPPGDVKTVADLSRNFDKFKGGHLLIRPSGRIETLASARLFSLMIHDIEIQLFIGELKGSVNIPGLSRTSIVLPKDQRCKTMRNGSVLVKLDRFDLWLAAPSLIEMISKDLP